MASKSSGVSQKDCSICPDPIDSKQVYAELDCSHIFHEACIGDWLDRAIPKTCPNCRAPEPKVHSKEVPKSEKETLGHLSTDSGVKSVKALNTEALGQTDWRVRASLYARNGQLIPFFMDC